jgi:hypothetical protein
VPRAAIRFEDIAARAGVSFITENCPTPNKNQPETMVSGVGVLDYDGDGDLDLYFVNGAAIPSLVKSEEKYRNRLFRNEGNLKFTDVTAQARAGGAGYGMGVAVGDYDNDGRPDVYVANVTPNQLLRNRGDGTFEDVTAKAGVAGGVFNGRKMWSVAAGWFDYDRDGWLDLFVSNYCVWEVNRDPVCTDPKGRIRAYCHPSHYSPLRNTLYRNRGDGTFTDVSAETGIREHAGKGMGVAFADFDGDGWMDVFVANDTTPNFLFRNIAGKRFEETALMAGVAYNESGQALSGMGADFRDLDNDGRPDIWHTAVEHETFPLYLNGRDGMFHNATARAGLVKPTWNMSGWSNGIADFDNDGWKDLFAARSNVLDNVASMTKREYHEPNAVFRNLGNGRFEDVSALAGPDFQQRAAHRGAALGDIDNDGRMDAVVTVLGGQAKVFRNVSGGSHHWITLQLSGVQSNWMGLGARIRITAADGASQYDHATTSAGYAASSEPRVHFGLGAAASVKLIEIEWPSGIRQVLRDVPADRIVRIEEAAN